MKTFWKSVKSWSRTPMAFFSFIFMFAVIVAFISGPSLAVALAVLSITAVLATAFPIIYAFSSRGAWMSTFTGVTMMTQGIIIALLLDFTILGVIGIFEAGVTLFMSVLLYTGLIMVKLNLIRLVLRWRVRENKERANG